MPITLVLADDYPIVLDGLEQIFRLEANFQVLARCLDGEATLRAIRLGAPGVVLKEMGIRTPLLFPNGGLSFLGHSQSLGCPLLLLFETPSGMTPGAFRTAKPAHHLETP